MSTTYKGHIITPFQQFTGAWLAVYSGPLINGTVRGYTRRQAAARAKLDILRESRSRAEKSPLVRANELRRATARTWDQTQLNWARVRHQDALPPKHRVKGLDAAPKHVERSALVV